MISATFPYQKKHQEDAPDEIGQAIAAWMQSLEQINLSTATHA